MSVCCTILALGSDIQIMMYDLINAKSGVPKVCIYQTAAILKQYTVILYKIFILLFIIDKQLRLTEAISQHRNKRR